MTNSRNKGANFEREIAQELWLQLGIAFKRDLDQYREKDRGDLIPDDPAFPFVIECKRAAKGFLRMWEDQVFAAAKTAGLYPALVYRFDNQKTVVRVWVDALSEAVGGWSSEGFYFETTLEGFAWVAREIMARRAGDV